MDLTEALIAGAATAVRGTTSLQYQVLYYAALSVIYHRLASIPGLYYCGTIGTLLSPHSSTRCADCVSWMLFPSKNAPLPTSTVRVRWSRVGPRAPIHTPVPQSTPIHPARNRITKQPNTTPPNELWARPSPNPSSYPSPNHDTTNNPLPK